MQIKGYCWVWNAFVNSDCIFRFRAFTLLWFWNINNNYFKSIKRNVYFANSTTTLIFIFIRNRFNWGVYKYLKQSIHNKRLLIFDQVFLYVYSMLSQLKQRILFSVFFCVNRNPQMFPQKACDKNYWDNHDCDGYSNLTALYITISTDAFLFSINSFQNVLCHWNLVHKKSLTPHGKMAVERNG